MLIKKGNFRLNRIICLILVKQYSKIYESTGISTNPDSWLLVISDDNFKLLQIGWIVPSTHKLAILHSFRSSFVTEHPLLLSAMSEVPGNK